MSDLYALVIAGLWVFFFILAPVLFPLAYGYKLLSNAYGRVFVSGGVQRNE